MFSIFTFSSSLFLLFKYVYVVLNVISIWIILVHQVALKEIIYLYILYFSSVNIYFDVK